MPAGGGEVAEALLVQLEREEAATKIQATERGKNARAKRELRRARNKEASLMTGVGVIA